MRRGNGAEWVEWRTGGLFYGLSEEVVMRVPYRLDGGLRRGKAGDVDVHSERCPVANRLCLS